MQIFVVKTGRSLNASGCHHSSVSRFVSGSNICVSRVRIDKSELAPAVQGSAWSLLAPHSCTAAHQLNRQLRGAISLPVARHAARDVQTLTRKVEAVD